MQRMPAIKLVTLIVGVLRGYTPLLDVEDDELKSVIIRALIRLYMDGTPPRDWKTKVLSGLPLRSPGRLARLAFKRSSKSLGIEPEGGH
jgi:hypothetical protein